MHVQSSCFANLKLFLFFFVLVAVAVALLIFISSLMIFVRLNTVDVKHCPHDWKSPIRPLVNVWTVHHV